MCHFALYDTPCGQRGWVVYIMVFLICTFCVVCHAQWTARWSCHYCGVSYVHFVFYVTPSGQLGRVVIIVVFITWHFMLYVTSSGQRGWVVIIMVFLMYIFCCMSRPVDSAVELSLLWCFLCIFCVVWHPQWTAPWSCLMRQWWITWGQTAVPAPGRMYTGISTRSLSRRVWSEPPEKQWEIPTISRTRTGRRYFWI